MCFYLLFLDDIEVDHRVYSVDGTDLNAAGANVILLYYEGLAVWFFLFYMRFLIQLSCVFGTILLAEHVFNAANYNVSLGRNVIFAVWLLVFSIIIFYLRWLT